MGAEGTVEVKEGLGAEVMVGVEDSVVETEAEESVVEKEVEDVVGEDSVVETEAEDSVVEVEEEDVVGEGLGVAAMVAVMVA